MFILATGGGERGDPIPLGDAHSTVLQFDGEAFIGAVGGASIIDASGARLSCPIDGIANRMGRSGPAPVVLADSGLVFVLAAESVRALDPADCG